MSPLPARNDASPSMLGSLYQILVAIEKGFELRHGESLVIEKMGDVSIPGWGQIETKHYADPLTELHDNFWNTLRNWVDDHFNDEQFPNLILLTTQSFGTRNRLCNWNSLSGNERLRLIVEISTEAKTKHDLRATQPRRKRASSAKILIKSPAKPIPSYLAWQKYILDPARRLKLERILPKIIITDKHLNYFEIGSRIQEVWSKGIPQQFVSQFVESLAGFLISSPVVSNRWTVTYDQFRNKVTQLTTSLTDESQRLPMPDIDSDKELLHRGIKHIEELQFVNKILEIPYREVTDEAVNEYLCAAKVIEEIFGTYAIQPSNLKRFYAELTDNFKRGRRISIGKVEDVERDSRYFYDRTVSEQAPELIGWGIPYLKFKNGIVHQILDNDDKLRWKLD